MSRMRAGTARRVCVIVPKISLKCYNDLYNGLEQYLREYEISIELISTNNLECDEEKAVKKALSLNPMAVVVVSFLRTGDYTLQIPGFSLPKER